MEDEQEKKPTLAVFEFQWNLTNIQTKTMTILSRMIEFRGAKIFRAGLKNQNAVPVSHPYAQAASSTLIFMATDLAKMGLRAETVFYSDMQRSGIVMKRMHLLTKKGAENLNGKVQLFTAQLRSLATEKEVYKFHVYITGVVNEFQFSQKDSLFNEQLWLSAKNRIGTDFEIAAGKKIFPVHKFILAARSSVFSAQFNEEKKGNTRLFDDSASMEEFLKFVYTGQLEGNITNPNKLKELATTYQIKTLEHICEAASKEIDEEQMLKFVLQFESLVGCSSVEIMYTLLHYNIFIASGIYKHLIIFQAGYRFNRA